MEPSFVRRRALACSFLFSLSTAAIFLFLNWPSGTVQIGVKSFGGGDVGTNNSFGLLHEEITRAGWPLNYWTELTADISASSAGLSHQADPSPITLKWSLWSLVLNLLFGAVCVFGVGWLTMHRHHRISSSDQPTVLGRRYDFATAMLCLLIPMTIVGLSWRTSRNHQRLAERLSIQGHCELTAEVPRWLGRRIPDTFRDAFLRLRLVDLAHLSDSSLREIMSVSTLRTLKVSRTRIEPGGLDGLRSSRELFQLTLRQCRLADDSIEAISRHDRLHSLSLPGTRIEPSDLVSLGRLPNLLSADLTYTGIRLSNLQSPAWRKSVRRLRLTRPFSGTSDRLTLDGWQSLEHLVLQNFELRKNEEVFELHLANCPMLETINLDRWQLHDLKASNLPRLRNIFESIESFFLQDTSTPMPELTRWRDVELDGLPRLADFQCNADDLRTLRLRGLDSLRSMEIGKLPAADRAAVNREFPVETHQRGEATAQWIAALSQIPSIETLSLEGIELGPDHIAQLSTIRSLREIFLYADGLESEHLRLLLNLPHLEKLHVRDCRVNRELVERFLASTSLKSFWANLSQIDRLTIRQNDRLTVFASEPLERLRSLELENLPRLQASIVVKNSIERLHIVNVPRLFELVVACPWPVEHKIAGIEGLSKFAGGGPGIDDSVVDSLMQSRNLDELTLAYPNLSQGVLKRLGTLKLLTSLEVPGCDISDGIAQAWTDLKRLRRICFDDAKISLSMLRWMSSLESLRSLSLNHVQLDQKQSQAFGQLSQVAELSLIDSKIDESALIALLDGGNLTRVDLSGWKVSDALMESLAHSRGLDYCAMYRCEVADSAIIELLRRNPNLRIELDRIDPEAFAASAGPTYKRRYLLQDDRGNDDDVMRFRYATPNSHFIPSAVLTSRRFQVRDFRQPSSI